MSRKINTVTISIFILLVSAVFIARINALKASITAEVEKPEFINQLGKWKFNREIPISSDILRILGTKGAALAEYEDASGDKLWLYILKSRGRRSSIHQPEYCYIGSGRNELLERGKKIVDIDTKNKITVNYIFAQNERGFQIVAYFYTVDDFITSNYYLQQIVFLLKRLKGKDVEASLVRISKFIKGNDYSSDLESLEHVAADIVMSLRPSR